MILHRLLWNTLETFRSFSASSGYSLQQLFADSATHQLTINSTMHMKSESMEVAYRVHIDADSAFHPPIKIVVLIIAKLVTIMMTKSVNPV